MSENENVTELGKSREEIKSDLLKQLQKNLRRGNFLLSSNGNGSYKEVLEKDVNASSKRVTSWLPVKKLVLDGICLSRLHDLIWPMLCDEQVDAIGAPAVSLGPLVGHLVGCHKDKLKGFTLRQERIIDTTQGKGPREIFCYADYIEGYLLENAQVILIEDCISTGSTILKHVSQCEKRGAKVIGVICILDRESGGIEYLWESKGLPVNALFKMSEVDVKPQYETLLPPDGPIHFAPHVYPTVHNLEEAEKFMKEVLDKRGITGPEAERIMSSLVEEKRDE